MTDGNYQCNESWHSIADWVKRHQREQDGMAKLDLNPDFQRGHVWSKQQQVDFVEFMLQGGKGSNILRFNCVGWMQDWRGPFVLVDGKQRLEAALAFMDNRVAVFADRFNQEGYRLCDFEDKLGSFDPNFVCMVNNLNTREKVLKWYLEINSGGVVHTDEELDKVRKLLKQETSK